MRLLIAEADAAVAAELGAAMATIGHLPTIVADGRTALAQAADGAVDAAVINAALPHVDGITLVERLRAGGINLPVIMVSVLDDLTQRLRGLDAGADDFIVLPAAPAEIDARLRAIFRRIGASTDSGILRAGDIEVNEVKHRATRAGRVLALQNLEFRLLVELVRNAGDVVTRDMLYARVWHYDAPPRTNLVEAYMRRLRRQLTVRGETNPIATIRGRGYMLRA